MNINTRDMNFVKFNNQDMEWVKFNGVIVWEGWKKLIKQGIPPLTLTKCKENKLLNYQIYGNSKQGELPDGYTQLEYIESTGTQYIDTGYIWTTNKGRVTSEIEFLSTGSFQQVFGSAVSRGGSAYHFPIRVAINAKSIPQLGIGYTAILLSNNITINKNYEIDIEANNGNYNCKFGDETITGSYQGSIINNLSSYLFAQNYTPVMINPSMRCRSYKVYDNNTLVRNFIPCKNPQGVGGMYDTVTKTFFGNAGTGTFVAGPEMPNPTNPTNPIEIQSVGDNETGLPLGYTQLEYIESTGTQYINTEVIASDNIKILTKFAITNTNAERNYPFGSGNLGGARIQFSYSSSAFYGWGTNYDNTSTLSVDTQEHIVEVSTSKFLLDNVSVYTPNSINFNSAIDVFLFAVNVNNNPAYYSNGVKIYYTRIYDNNNLIRNFIPCKNSSGTIGMYDTITNTFYTNQGTGTFTAGNEIAKGGYKIPVSVTDTNNITTTTNIYLSEPLRKIDNYADYIDYQNQKVIRKVKQTTIKAIDFIYHSGSTYGRFERSVPDKLFTNRYSRNVICEVFKTSIYNLTEDNSISERHNYNNLRIYTSLYSSASKLNAAVGNNKVYYVLATPTEESIELPDVLLNKGTNVVDIETSITPSNLWLKYKGK